MNRKIIIITLLVLIFGSSGWVLADEWSASGGRIAQLNVMDGLGVQRIWMNDVIGVNPAGCTATGGRIVDIQLNAPSRSPEEQQLLLNALYLAYMTNRNVRLRISDAICSSAGTSASYPVVVGILVSN